MVIALVEGCGCEGHGRSNEEGGEEGLPRCRHRGVCKNVFVQDSERGWPASTFLSSDDSVFPVHSPRGAQSNKK